MSRVEHDPSDRIIRLRETLLSGRGPGASDQEVLDHTRNRPTLGAVPAPVERALVARQGDQLRAGEPIAVGPARARVWSSRRRYALIGAAAALAARAVAMRLLRSRRAPH